MYEVKKVDLVQGNGFTRLVLVPTGCYLSRQAAARCALRRKRLASGDPTLPVAYNPLTVSQPSLQIPDQTKSPNSARPAPSTFGKILRRMLGLSDPCFVCM